ncbi:MAG: carboxymuconolactone decarboxylase family protein [Deltaproteobacteria bacterium]|nr:carboxymuconolactone decarboxylase family protein [Deltaproteobacteria bacterium]
MRLKEPRIKPLPESEWNEEQKEILEYYRRPSGKIYNIFTTQSRHPEVMKSWRSFSGYILNQSTLPARDREMLILRIGWLCRSEYEFGQHTRIGQQAGLTSEEIVNITKGPNAAGWDPFDAALLRAVDELHADAFISDDTWHVLSRRYDEKQMIDLIMTVGNYNMVSMFLNSVGVQLDPKLVGFPDDRI